MIPYCHVSYLANMRLLRKVKTVFKMCACVGVVLLVILKSRKYTNCVDVGNNGLTTELTTNTSNASNLEIASEQVHPEITTVRKIAYFMWCDRDRFDFVNYLSLLSVVRFARAEKVIFQYLHLPVVDHLEYDTWFDELRQSVAILTLDNTSLSATICATEKTRAQFMLRTVSSRGGVYVGRRTIFIQPLNGFNSSFTNHLFSSYEGYAMSKPDYVYMRPTDQRATAACPLSNRLSVKKINSGSVACVYETREMYPKDFLVNTDLYSAAVRYLMYDNKEIPSPVSRQNDLIPNIAHIMWVGGKPVDFLFYLCCLSLLYVVNVDRLFVHGEVPPTGIYWDKIKVNVKVTFIRRELPNFVFNQKAAGVHLMSDIFRSEIMTKYGGIYSDVDVIWTQPLNEEIRSYDAVASLDWAKSYWPYPNYINLGVSLGKRNAPFWRKFRRSLRNLKSDVFGFNGLLQPYKLYERSPDTLHLDDHLQVMCFRNNCYPLWGADYKKIDWRTETHAFHWTWPTPEEFTNHTTLMNSNTIWAQIGQYVLRKAGLL